MHHRVAGAGAEREGRKEGRNAPRGKPDFFLLSERLGFCRRRRERERERERELKMMEEKSAAKCTKRFLREGKEGRKEGRKKDRETERGGVENAVAAADGGGGCCDDGGKVQLLLDLKRRKMRRRTTGKEEEEEGQGGRKSDQDTSRSQSVSTDPSFIV